MWPTDFFDAKEEVSAATALDRLGALRLEESSKVAELFGVVWESAENPTYVGSTVSRLPLVAVQGNINVPSNS